jgi:hypothetical protein
MARAGSEHRASAAAAALALLALPLAASCHRSADDQPVLPPDQLANAIEAVRVERKVTPPPPKRIAFLLPADLVRTGRVTCTLRQHGKPLLLGGPDGALARVDGRLQRLAAEGPIGPSGAFFKRRGVTISIGRHDPVAPQAEAPGIAWPVGVTIGGLMDVADEKLAADWSCG